jgi:hypothetical protein
MSMTSTAVPIAEIMISSSEISHVSLYPMTALQFKVRACCLISSLTATHQESSSPSVVFADINLTDLDETKDTYFIGVP